MDFDALRATYGDLPEADLLRLYWAEIEMSLNTPLPTGVLAVDGSRPPSERQLRSWKDSVVGAIGGGAYARGYTAGYGD